MVRDFDDQKYGMNIGKACAVFEQIESDKYSDDEKLRAIWAVLDMPTHNGITKNEILTAFRWLFNYAAEIDPEEEEEETLVKDALKKLKPMKIEHVIEKNGSERIGYYKCPVCGARVSRFKDQIKYCPNCGQRLEY